jgi:hypothetical protein
LRLLIEGDADPILHGQAGGDRMAVAAQVLNEGLPGVIVCTGAYV